MDRLRDRGRFRRKPDCGFGFVIYTCISMLFILIYVLYKRELINTFETIGNSCCIMMSIVTGPKWSYYSCCDYIGLLGISFMQVLYLGRAPCTKETLPDLLKWRRVTRHPLVFRGLTGSQRTPGIGVSHI